MDHVTLKPPQRPKEWVRRDLLEMDDEAELAHFKNALARWAPLFFYFTLATAVAFLLFHTIPALADAARLPGEDISAKMESAGTLLRFVDTGIFKWTARILAGLCIFGAGWNLKEMRFGWAKP